MSRHSASLYLKKNYTSPFLINPSTGSADYVFCNSRMSICQSAFAAKGARLAKSVRSHLNQSIQQLRVKIFPAIGYFDGPILDPSDTISIHQALSVNEGDSAAIIDINPFIPIRFEFLGFDKMKIVSNKCG